VTLEQALQNIRAHQRIANDPATSPHKRAQHLASVRWLRCKFGIPEPEIVRAVPATEFERLKARLEPHVTSKPDWTKTQRYHQ
jgi:hypothetical protein